MSSYLFLIPPAFFGENADINFGCNYGIISLEPAHILYPAAVLEKEEHHVDFIDAPAEEKSVEDIQKLLQEDKYDYYVFFSVFLSQERDLRWARQVKKHTKGLSIFMGPEPAHKPDYFFDNGADIVISGEPEMVITSAKERGQLLHGAEIEELDSLPFPARHLVKNPYKYFSAKLQKKPIATMITSRNCYGRCIYCIPAAYMFAREIESKKTCGKKPKVSLRSPENIATEFKHLKKNSYKSVAIMDDNFVNGKERTNKICELIKDLDMEWGCLARADTLQDEDMLKNMKEAGCKYIDIGVESFNQKVLDYVKKDTTAGEVLNAILLMKHVGIEPKINILLGCSPYQTEDDIKTTMEILRALDIRVVSFGVVTPHPMTEYYNIIKKNEWFKYDDWKGVDPYKEAEINLPGMSGKKLNKLIRQCYRKYYLNPKYLWNRLKEIESFEQFVDYIKIARRLFS